MDITDDALLAEIKTGPRAANYTALVASGNDTGLTDLLNVASIDLPAGFPVLIARSKLHDLGTTAGWLARVRRIAQGRMDDSAITDAAQRTGLEIACETIMDVIEAGTDIPTIDLHRPQVQAVLGALRAFVAFTGYDDAAAADIAALIPAKCSVAQLLANSLSGSVDSTQVSRVLHPERQAAYDATQAAIQAKAAEILAANPEMSEREALERADQILHGANWGHS